MNSVESNDFHFDNNRNRGMMVNSVQIWPKLLLGHMFMWMCLFIERFLAAAIWYLLKMVSTLDAGYELYVQLGPKV